MSQLNNEKKTSTAKKTFLMLVVFAIICAGVTAVLIYNTISTKKENNISKNTIGIENTVISEKEEKNEEVEENRIPVEKVKLTDKYFTNGIVIEEKNISFGDVVQEYHDSVTRQLEINYFQISGLKNTDIQDKINKEIEDTVLSLRDYDELNKEGVKTVHIGTDLLANFSDVISVSIYKSIQIGEGQDATYESKELNLNYSLKDGEKIKFNDLFTEDAGIKNIITQSAYESLAWEYDDLDDEEYGGDMTGVDYRDIEDRTFKILSKYKQDPNFDFYFTTSAIYFNVDEITYTINMVKFYDSIAIYTRYKSEENLYEDETLVKNNCYVFATADISDFIYDTGYKTDNLYYEILDQGAETENEELKKAKQEALAEINTKINEYAIRVNENKEKGYILSFSYYTNEHEGTVSYSCNGILCSMDRDFYNENLEETLASVTREGMAEIWARDYSWLDEENITFEEDYSLYVDDINNPIKKERITTREDRERMEAEIQ